MTPTSNALICSLYRNNYFEYLYAKNESLTLCNCSSLYFPSREYKLLQRLGIPRFLKHPKGTQTSVSVRVRGNFKGQCCCPGPDSGWNGYIDSLTSCKLHTRDNSIPFRNGGQDLALLPVDNAGNFQVGQDIFCTDLGDWR